MSVPLLIHHAANRGHSHPSGSVRALSYCLEAGAKVVELDITPLADGDFALLHDMHLEKATDGTGYTSAAPADQVRQLHYTRQGVATDEPVGLLSQAVALLRGFPHLQELQLDLKAHAPLTVVVLEALLRVIEPVKDQVRVTSVADWALRQLFGLDADLSLGFDPLLYLDVNTEKERDETTPPYRLGAYGYRDDHPLAHRQWGSTPDYLAARAGVLSAQVPSGTPWYIRGALLARALDDGFDWIVFAHAQGTQVTAWTLDADQPDQVILARRLVKLGVDRITTNDPPTLARALGGAVGY